MTKLAVALGAALLLPLVVAPRAQAAVSQAAPPSCTASGATATSATVTLEWGADAADRPVRLEFLFDGPAFDVRATVRTSRSEPTNGNVFVFNAKANNAATTVALTAWNSAGASIWTGSAVCRLV